MSRLTPLALAAAAGLALVVPTHGDAAADRAAVERAVLDYVEAFYEVRPELIERSVHPDLAKFGFWRGPEDQDYRSGGMTYEQLHDLAATLNADGKRFPEGSPKVVEVLDVMDRTAAVKLTAAWGIDYLHVAKLDGGWKILHAVWQTPPRADDHDHGAR